MNHMPSYTVRVVRPQLPHERRWSAAVEDTDTGVLVATFYADTGLGALRLARDEQIRLTRLKDRWDERGN